MEKENVITKIQKLLKLQYGAEQIGSTGEAYQAAKMVRKLLMEYNLSMSDINTSDGEQKLTMSKSEELTGSDRYGNHWKFRLLGVIASNNLCSAYQRVSGKMFVIGTEDNMAIVQEFYNYLVKVFRRLAKEHRNVLATTASPKERGIMEGGVTMVVDRGLLEADKKGMFKKWAYLSDLFPTDIENR